MLRQIYMSPLGSVISLIMRGMSWLHRPYMVYGYKDKPSGLFRKHTRISSTADLIDRSKIAMGDHVWVGHNSIVDGSNGVTIGDGVQIAFGVHLFTHSSHNAGRLHGQHYIAVPAEERIGYVRGPVTIGEYTVICSGAMILPNITIGKGCVVSGGSIVTHDVPDYAIVRGGPARIVGDTRAVDAKFWGEDGVAQSHFHAKDVESWIADQDRKASH